MDGYRHWKVGNIGDFCPIRMLLELEVVLHIKYLQCLIHRN